MFLYYLDLFAYVSLIFPLFHFVINILKMMAFLRHVIKNNNADLTCCSYSCDVHHFLSCRLKIIVWEFCINDELKKETTIGYLVFQSLCAYIILFSLCHRMPQLSHRMPQLSHRMPQLSHCMLVTNTWYSTTFC